jgi:glycosyltransferase involved in cell wall biosynthesis
MVPSEYNRANVLRVTDVPERIRVIPNALDTELFAPRSAGLLRDRFGDLIDKTVVLWIGRLEDEKEPQAFLALGRALLAREHDFHFVCIGDAPHDANYQSRLTSPLSSTERPNFTFITTVPYSDMPLFYSLAAATGGCLVSTSRSESVPMTFIEAMACGCPVLSSDVGGVRELIDDGVNGMLFELGDCAAAARAVQLLSSKAEAEHRARLVNAAHLRVEARHSLAAVGERMAALFDEILREPAKSVQT